ncbi:MAG: amidase [Solirubrobacterales bacterium]
MRSSDLAFSGLAAQSQALAAGEVSSGELTQLCLARIGRHDGRLNSFRTVYWEQALAEADRADDARGGGDDRPLLGVPIAIKDVFDVEGDVTTQGSAANETVATADAEVVRRLREAGAVIVGKTTTPELAQWGFTESAAWGATRNPWDTGRQTGGSSGGTAAAVAAGLVGAALGSDGAGSIRIPAAACGLFGLKPQRGRVSLAPATDHWHGLSTAGPLTRRVLDSAMFYDAVAADHPHAPNLPADGFAAAAERDPGRLRIAVVTEPMLPWLPVTQAAHDGVQQVVDALRTCGHDVEPGTIEAGGPLATLMLLPRYLRGIRDDAQQVDRPERLERRTRQMARLGGLVPDAVLHKVREAEPTWAERVNSLLIDHDVILMPTLAHLPPRVGRWEGQGALRTLDGMTRYVPFTQMWNVTGQPAASIPTGGFSEGMPLSAQLVGRPNDEVTLLSLAAQLEEELGWPDAVPPEFAGDDDPPTETHERGDG